MIGGVAAATAVRTFPFRVFNFPAEIVKPQLILTGSIESTFLQGDEVDITGLLDMHFYDAFRYAAGGILRAATPHVLDGKYTIQSVDTEKHIVTLS